MSAETGRVRPPSFLQDGLRLISNQFLTTLVNFASGVILARSIGPEGRGLLAAVAVYPTIFLIFAQMGVRQASAFYLGRHLFSDQQVVGAVSALGVLVATLGVLVCGGALATTGNAAFTPLIIVLTVASLPLTLVEYLSTGIFLGKQLVGQLVRVQQMAVLQRLLMVVILVWWLGFQVPGALLASLLSGALVAVFALRRIARIAPVWPRFEWHVVWALLSKGIVYSVVLFVGVLVERMDIVLLERLSTLEEIGLYTTGVAVCQLTALLPNALSPALFSYSTNAANPNEFAGRVGLLLRMTLIFIILVMIVLVPLSPLLIPLVYGPKFALAADVVLLFAPGTVASVYTKMLVTDLAGRGHPYSALWATVPGLAIMLVLDWVLIPRYGALGAAVGSSLSQSLVALVLTLIYCHHVKMLAASLLRYRATDFAFITRLYHMIIGSATKLSLRSSGQRT